MSRTKEKTREARFKHILEIASDQKFLKNEGIDVVPFYISAYEPELSNDVTEDIERLKSRLDKQGIKVLEINLYDISVDILKQNGDWDWYLEKEPELDKQVFKEELQGILDVEQVLRPTIAKLIENIQHDLVFLTGIGEVFPFIRSHSILNNLQAVAKHKPTIIFYPGEYQNSLDKGATLKLFNKLGDDNYYQAFNIEDCDI